ncbi:hypothetical protein QI193_02745 [Staphylococcus saprophyticus]|nr:hypothetical protein [Staphylococcus saprophyticus]
MFDVAIYLIIIIGFAFMIYQTHKFIRQLKIANEKGHSKDVYIFSAILIIIWVIYIFALAYALIAK